MIKTFFKQYKNEVKLLAENNYGDFGTGEEVDVNVMRAIDEIANKIKEELKKSDEAREIIGEIIDSYGF